jgi:outer membrane protein insertion porin family
MNFMKKLKDRLNIPTAKGFSTRRQVASRRNVYQIHEDGERRRQQSRKFIREGDIKKWSGYFLLLLFVFTTAIAYAADSFVIKKIKIEGLEGMPRATVLNYLPVRVGDQFDSSRTHEIIRSLYKARFFKNVSLGREGDTLIIYVKQRAIIGKITLSGNKTLKTDKMRDALKRIGFVEGGVFEQGVLENIQRSLQAEYKTVGKYSAVIKTSVKPAPRNRVLVTISIDEGATAKVKQIHIVGNRAFSQYKLLRQLKLSRTNLFSFFTHKDLYSEDALNENLAILEDFYLNHGYLHFKVLSKKVTIDKQGHVSIRLQIKEGARYQLSDYTFSGRTILPKATLKKVAGLKVGDFFSRKQLIVVNERIGNALGKKGYANVVVKPIPKIDEKKKTVLITFHIVPGKRVYIRRITFSGNYHTNDNVLRRELLQQEATLFSTTKLKASKRGLLTLPFIRQADMSVQPVPGKPDQVDVNYKIVEAFAGSLSAGLAFSRLDKFMVKLGMNHPNIFGSGSAFGFNVLYSRPSTRVDIRYFNPYYTASGIGQGLNIYASKFNAERANISRYALDRYGIDVNYSIPIAQDHHLQFGYGIDHEDLQVGADPADEVTTFVDEHGRHFTQLSVSGGWIYNGFDRSIFPTKGLHQSAGATLSIPLGKRSLEYYKLHYNFTYYHPLPIHLIGQLRGAVGYGNGYGRYKMLPFFKNYYGGGMGSVRGYVGNSLGPKDSKGDSLGGNFEANGTVGIVFPNPFSENLRTTWFVDAGNIYDKVSLKNLKYSTGLELDWLSPMGMLNFSFSKAFCTKPDDEKQVFDFSFGMMF